MAKIYTPGERDFTVKLYRRFLETLRDQGFLFVTYSESLKHPNGNYIILRHDVDRSPLNSLMFARIQSGLNIKGSYYFRIVSQSFNENIIRQIHELGHEVGYHYEDMSLAADRIRNNNEEGIAETAIKSFRYNLEKFRNIAPVSTICMHGSPFSRRDSRLLWKYYNYRDYGISGEPYFDTDFTRMLYLTDTGRRWNGSRVSIRDKADKRHPERGIKSKASDEIDRYTGWKVRPVKGSLMDMTDEGLSLQNNFRYRSTIQILNAIEDATFPPGVLFTFHPQRWTDNSALWTRELLWQNIKNLIKYGIARR